MSKVLVTGVAGLIGSWVANELITRGHEVVGIDNYSGGRRENVVELTGKGMTFINDDVANICDHKRFLTDVEVVYHFAACAAEIQSLYRPCNDVMNNLFAFHRLMEECIRLGSVKRFVFTSSMAAYGHLPESKAPFREDERPQPADFYGVNKLAIEHSLPIYKSIHGIDYVIFNPHNVFGSRQVMDDPYRNVLAIWASMINHGKSPFVYGDGNQVRSFTHISDVSPWIADAGFDKRYLNAKYNIGSTEPVRLKDACALLCKEMDWVDGYKFAPARVGEVKIAYCDQSKLKASVGYKAKVKFADGLKEFCGYAKTQKDLAFNYIDDWEIQKGVPIQWREKWL